MQMYFYASNKVTILVQAWTTSSDLELFASAVVVFVIGVICEAVRYYKEVHNVVSSQSEYEDPDPDPQVEKWLEVTRLISSVVQGVLHFSQMFLSYLLMLIAMTFNVWLFFAVISGLTCGYLLFSSRRPSVVAPETEDCS